MRGAHRIDSNDAQSKVSFQYFLVLAFVTVPLKSVQPLKDISPTLFDILDALHRPYALSSSPVDLENHFGNKYENKLRIEMYTQSHSTSLY